MLTYRVIPCLDVNQGRVVKGVNFVDLRDAGVGKQIHLTRAACQSTEFAFISGCACALVSPVRHTHARSKSEIEEL